MRLVLVVCVLLVVVLALMWATVYVLWVVGCWLLLSVVGYWLFVMCSVFRSVECVVPVARYLPSVVAVCCLLVCDAVCCYMVGIVCCLFGH